MQPISWGLKKTKVELYFFHCWLQTWMPRRYFITKCTQPRGGSHIDQRCRWLISVWNEVKINQINYHPRLLTIKFTFSGLCNPIEIRQWSLNNVVINWIVFRILRDNLRRVWGPRRLWLCVIGIICLIKLTVVTLLMIATESAQISQSKEQFRLEMSILPETQRICNISIRFTSGDQ